MKRRLNIFILGLLLVTLAGCGGGTVAPVSERGIASSRNHAAGSLRGTARGYRVERGDTLYSIAFRFGRDYRELAELNHIKPPYTIYVGQHIRLSPAPRPKTRTAATTPAEPAPPPKAVLVIAPKHPSSPPPKPAEPAKSPPHKVAKAPESGPPRWQWPVHGRILTRFDQSSAGRKGIDIAGNMGQPVHAAAAGVVVYSGSGLRGYGELIIVKHNNNYLSAYAHNRRLLAREGDELKAGDTLAEMGRSETDRVMLHFEIRHDGKPVDPILYLPKR